MKRFSLLCLLGCSFLTVTNASPVWVWYRNCLQQRPLLTKSITSSVIMVISDAICQNIESSALRPKSSPTQQPVSKKNPSRVSATSSSAVVPHDWGRTRDVAITGLVWSGPISHTWYAVLESIVTVQNKVLGLACRSLLDAAIFSPIAGKK